jgi:hypothetical protein
MLAASVGKKRTLLQVGFVLWLVCLQMCVLFRALAIFHAATIRLKVYLERIRTAKYILLLTKKAPN